MRRVSLGQMFTVSGSNVVHIKIGDGDAISVCYSMSGGRTCVSSEYDEDWRLSEIRINTTPYHALTKEAWDGGKVVYKFYETGSRKTRETASEISASEEEKRVAELSFMLR